MANTRELRRRIRSVKNTSQITKAMQMVAATKMRRAQNQAINGRPYSQALNFSLSKLVVNTKPEAHPFLMDSRSSSPSLRAEGLRGNDGKVGVVLFSTDKGLVGALNTNLLRLLSSSNSTGGSINNIDSRSSSLSLRAEGLRGNDVVFYTVGKKGRSFVAKTGKNLEADFENLETVTFRQAKQIAKLIIAEFLSGKLGEIYLIYPDFVSALRQEPRIVRLLPINPTVIPSQDGIQSFKSRSEVDSHLRGNNDSSNREFLFEPTADELLDSLLVHSIETKIYQALLETKASEHSARMIAMQNATDNAKELVQDLNLTYNQTRQDAITRELLEITSAGLALQ